MSPARRTARLGRSLGLSLGLGLKLGLELGLGLFPSVASAGADPCTAARGVCSARDDVILDGVRGVSVDFEVDDDLDHLWALVADCMEWPRYIPTFGDCVLLERTRDGARYSSTITIAGKRMPVVCESTRDALHHVEHHRVSGDFRSMTAQWRLVALDERRTRVTYTIAVDYAWYAPGSTVRGHLQAVLADVVRGIERRAAERAASTKAR